MLLPIGDAPNPRSRPLVTYGLIAACVGVYLFVNLPLGLVRPQPDAPGLEQYLELVAARNPGVPLAAIYQRTSAFDLFSFRYGFRPASPRVLALFTSLFLHSGLLHLAGNMLFLWIYGDNVEDRLGRWRFLLAYLGSGAAATLFFALFAQGSQVPLVGASGAISGILGFYFVWFPRNVVRLWIFIFPFWSDVVQVPARWVLGVFVVVDNLLPFLFSRSGAGVAYGAHLGGFLTGALAAWGIARWGKPAPARTGGGAEPRAWSRERRLDRSSLQRLVDSGRFAEAASAYFRLAPEEANRHLDAARALDLAEGLATHGQAEAASVVYRRLLRDYPRGSTAARAHLGMGLVQLHLLDLPAPAYQHFLEALDCDPSPEVANAAREALAELGDRGVS